MDQDLEIASTNVILDPLLFLEFNYSNLYSILYNISSRLQLQFILFCMEQHIHYKDSSYRKSYEQGSGNSLEELAAFIKLMIDGSAKEVEDARCKLNEQFYSQEQLDKRDSLVERVVHLARFHKRGVTFRAVQIAHMTIDYICLPKEQLQLLIEQEQVNFLRNLILDNLTEEQKENWLLVASI